MSTSAWSQKTLVKSFVSISAAEKSWTLQHPFIAKRAWKITVHVRQITDSLRQLSIPDRDGSGGRLDAFRHTFWMATLTKQIGARRALSLGRAHERGNYRDFRRKRFEDGDIPDKAAGDMDLYNNGIGSAIGKSLKESAEKIVIDSVLSAIYAGKTKIVLKDTEGRSCDSLMQPIPAVSLKGIWKTTRVLVNSDYKNFK